MPIYKSPRRVADVLDSEGKITGHEIEYAITADGLEAEYVRPQNKWEAASAETVDALRATSTAALTAEIKRLGQQIADERAAAEARREAEARAAEETLAAKNAELADLRALVDEALASA